MTEPTKEQMRVFWEGCGLRIHHIKDSFAVKEHYEFCFNVIGDGVSENWEEVWAGFDMSDFLTLDNLFKYAVPKLGVGLDYIQFKFRKEGWLCVVRGVGLEKRAFYYDDPALALFWALDKIRETNEELEKELEKRGTAEITNGIVNQVTQALDEKETEATYMVFGEVKHRGIIPIDEACANCGHCYFVTIKECQDRQGGDARARGFTKVICPQQFTD
ncbi:hypothetical protein LCGC14_0383450 [marine sediment metagenome]|uniref:Uncharacterized protein n=1 Tax=marine sediment metagenome TaxID=412755 RepID=A0A0F9VNX4_9ZZZZ